MKGESTSHCFSITETPKMVLSVISFGKKQNHISIKKSKNGKKSGMKERERTCSRHPSEKSRNRNRRSKFDFGELVLCC